jgi:hypothetical protein
MRFFYKPALDYSFLDVFMCDRSFKTMIRLLMYLIASVSLFRVSAWSSELTALWPTIIEVINITESHGGPESDVFSDVIAGEAIRKWIEFSTGDDGIKADAKNDAFYRYQRRMYDKSRHRKFSNSTELANSPVTWPELQALPEYKRLREHIAKFGKRYLERLGYDTSGGFNIFSWAAVHSDSDYHGPHTHTGELVVGVYYARVTRTSGRLRLFDPRGTVPPFGKTYDFSCQSGQMIFFPSWLQHAALTTKIDGDNLGDDYRVIIAFNIGIGGGRGDLKSLEWHLDPVSGYQSTQLVPIVPNPLAVDSPPDDFNPSPPSCTKQNNCETPKRIEL